MFDILTQDLESSAGQITSKEDHRQGWDHKVLSPGLCSVVIIDRLTGKMENPEEWAPSPGRRSGDGRAVGSSGAKPGVFREFLRRWAR